MRRSSGRWLSGLEAYSTLDLYISGAVRRMSAPFMASKPVWPRKSSTASFPRSPPYIMAKVSRAYFLIASSFMSGNRPYVSRFPTDATGTPFTPRARGRPRPKLMPVSTFAAPGSISRITRPSQPSWPTSSGRAVCQMSIERKCDRFGLG